MEPTHNARHDTMNIRSNLAPRSRSLLLSRSIAPIVLVGIGFVVFRADDTTHHLRDRRAGQAAARGLPLRHGASIPRAAAQPALLQQVFLPLVAASADLRSPDIVREPAIPSEWSADADFVLGGSAMAVDVEGDVAYVGIGAHLVAMDVSGDGEPVTLGASPPLPGIVSDVVVRDAVAFAAVSQVQVVPDEPGGLFVLDVSDPAAIDVVGVTPIVGGATDLAVDGDRVLMLSAESDREESGNGPKFFGLTLVDISSPAGPRRERRWPLTFDELRTDVEILGDTGYFCDGVLFEIDLGASDAPRQTRPGFPCSRLKLFDSRARLAVAADIFSGEPPTVSLVDPSAPDRFETMELIDETEPGEYPVDVIEDMAVSGEEEDELIISGWTLDETSAVGRIDIGEWPVVSTTWTPMSEIVGLAIAEYGDRAIVAAADSFRPWTLYALWDIGLMHILGSAVAVIPGSASHEAAPTVKRTGPGTTIVGIESIEDRIYVLDVSIESRGGLLWSFDGTSRYPTVLGTAPFEDEFWTKGEPYYSMAANRTGVFLAGEEGVVNIYDVRDGAPVRAGALTSYGMIVAEGGTLFIADAGGQLDSLDVSDPTRPRLLSTFELPPHDLQSIALDDGFLWLGAGESFESGTGPIEPPENIVIDVRDPSHPVLLGPFPHDPTRGYSINAWRIEAVGDTAFVYEPNWLDRLGRYEGSQIVTLQVPIDLSPPVLKSHRTLATAFADTDTIYPFTSGLWADRFWIPRRLCSTCDQDLRLISLDVRDPPDPSGDQMHEFPAALRARDTLRLDDREFHGLAITFATSEDRLFVARIEGGFAGYSTLPRRSIRNPALRR